MRGSRATCNRGADAERAPAPERSEAALVEKALLASTWHERTLKASGEAGSLMVEAADLSESRGEGPPSPLKSDWPSHDRARLARSGEAENEQGIHFSVFPSHSGGCA